MIPSRSNSLRPWGALVSAWLLGCAADQATVCARAPDAQWVIVPHPPPAALPEAVPPRPEGAVWSDGRWIWRRGHWVWMRGGWIEAAPELCRVKSRVAFFEDGRIGYADSYWMYRGQVVEPEMVTPAGYPPRHKTSEGVTGP